MTTKYWEPKALSVAQITYVTVGGTLAGETFTISVDGVDIASHTDADTIIATTVAALVAAWNNSTHAYATGITAVDFSPFVAFAGDTGGAIGGGSESGSPFILTLNVPGGAAIFTQLDANSATSVNNFNDASNFSDGALPGAGDTVIIASTNINICWGLELVAATGITLKVEQSYTGMIGLRTSSFAANVAGDVYDESAVEYRPTYLQLDILNLDIGANSGGVGTPEGSTRIKIDNDRASASTTRIFNTAETSEETNLPAVRLLYNNNGATMDCLLTGTGGAGVGVDKPDEVATFGGVYIDGEATRFSTGMGVTLLNWEQHQGTCTLGAAAQLATLTRQGGELTVNEDVDINFMIDKKAGQTILNGTAVTLTVNDGGYVDGTQSGKARTWTTVSVTNGQLKIDFSIVTITTLSKPPGGRHEFGFLPVQ